MAKKVEKTVGKVSKRTGPSVVKAKPKPPEPKGRTGVPSLLGQAPKTYAFRLAPLNDMHSPVEVWGYQTPNGWEGWLEQFRRTQIQKTFWPKDKWREIPALAETDPSKKVASK